MKSFRDCSHLPLSFIVKLHWLCSESWWDLVVHLWVINRPLCAEHVLFARLAVHDGWVGEDISNERVLWSAIYRGILQQCNSLTARKLETCTLDLLVIYDYFMNPSQTYMTFANIVVQCLAFTLGLIEKGIQPDDAMLSDRSQLVARERWIFGGLHLEAMTEAHPGLPFRNLQFLETLMQMAADPDLTMDSLLANQLNYH